MDNCPRVKTKVIKVTGGYTKDERQTYYFINCTIYPFLNPNNQK